MHWKAWMAGVLCVGGAVGSAAPARAANYSLLIGINQYIEPGNDLEGCENDVRSMRKLLALRQFPSDAAHQKVLLSKKATGVAIVDGLRWLVRTVKPEDGVVIYYSGHGIFFPDGRSPARDESDGWDEAICPADCDAKGVLIDDDIHAALSLLKARNVTVLFDSCFSGTAQRAIGDPRATNPLALLGLRNRQRDIDPSRLKRLRAEFGGANRGATRGPAPAGGKAKPQRADDGATGSVVYLGGCQPWEVSDDGGPAITDNGKPYRGGLFTSLLYLAIREHGIQTSWRNLMQEVRRRAAVLNPLQEPYAEGPIDRAPFTMTAGTAGKAAPQLQPAAVPPVALHLVTAVREDRKVQTGGKNAADLAARVAQSLRDLSADRFVQLKKQADAVRMGLMQTPEGYLVAVPFYDGTRYQEFGTYNEAVQHLVDGVRFIHRLRQMTTLHHPAGPWRVRLNVAGGPSAVVPGNGRVSGTFTVAQPCAVHVLRLNAQGELSVVMSAPSCTPGQRYSFSFNAGTERGKELIKVIASPRPLELEKLKDAENPLALLAQQLGSAASEWAEDQESVYVGEWRG